MSVLHIKNFVPEEKYISNFQQKIFKYHIFLSNYYVVYHQDLSTVTVMYDNFQFQIWLSSPWRPKSTWNISWNKKSTICCGFFFSKTTSTYPISALRPFLHKHYFCSDRNVSSERRRLYLINLHRPGMMQSYSNQVHLKVPAIRKNRQFSSVSLCSYTSPLFPRWVSELLTLKRRFSTYLDPFSVCLPSFFQLK